MYTGVRRYAWIWAGVRECVCDSVRVCVEVCGYLLVCMLDEFTEYLLETREALDPPLYAPRKSTDLKFSKNCLREISGRMLSFKEII